MAACNKGLETNHLASSVNAIQKFFVHELCDVYIEFSKPILYGNRLSVSDFDSDEERHAKQLAAQATLQLCLDHAMRLLHPFTPFLTEELWYE